MFIQKIVLASLCFVALTNPLPTIAACADPLEVTALKIASLQQRLMVAGLACNDAEAYNRFVLAHRAELQRSDDELKSYFIKNGGEAGYDTYKTREANLAAQGPATDQNAFCAATANDFALLERNRDLWTVAADERLTVGEACEVTVAAANRSAAPAQMAVAEVVVSAPIRNLPAVPYANAPPPAPKPQLVAAQSEDYNDVPPPPLASSRNDNGYYYWYYRRLYAHLNANADTY